MKINIKGLTEEQAGCFHLSRYRMYFFTDIFIAKSRI